MTIRELVTKWGFDVDDKPLRRAEAGVANLKKSIRQLSIFTVGATTAIFGLVKSTAAAGNNIAKTADKLGVGIESLQEMRFAAERAGVAQNTFDMALQRFTRRAAEAAKGTGEAKAVLEEMGITLKDAQGNIRPTEELLGEIADRMENNKDSADRLRIAFKLFDSEGAKLVTLLQKGSTNFEEMRKQARLTGNVLSENTARAAERFEDTFQDTTEIIKGLKNAIGAELLPQVNRILKRFNMWVIINRKLLKVKITNFIQHLIKLIKIILNYTKRVIAIIQRVTRIIGGLERTIKLLISAFLIFKALDMAMSLIDIAGAGLQLAKSFRFIGKAAIIANLKVAALAIGIAALFAGIFLIAEDIISYTQGRDSITGRLIQGIKDVVAEIKKTNLAAMIRPFSKSLADLFESLEKIKNIIADLREGRLNVVDVTGMAKEALFPGKPTALVPSAKAALGAKSEQEAYATSQNLVEVNNHFYEVSDPNKIKDMFDAQMQDTLNQWRGTAREKKK